MKTSISIASPIYNSSNGTVTISLTNASGGTADISFDFDELAPFANLVSNEVVDFFILSACAYGVDRFIERRENSVDGWSRELVVNLPVFNVSKWVNAKSEVESLLSFLTGDYWQLKFHKSQFSYPQKPFRNDCEGLFSQVNLFSGGLDSLIGAMDYLAKNAQKRILFVSHYDSQMGGPLKDQKALLDSLEEKHSGHFVHIPSVRLSLINSSLSSETTFRSRSILFIGIALIAAQAKGISIVVPENGTVSLNYPLSTSRRSACSTRTTHPTLILKLKELWNKVGISTHIYNPYEFETKGEMVAKCHSQSLLKIIVAKSNSCGKRGHRAHWMRPGASHCGVCMPCVYRRASLQHIKDNTSYGNDLNDLPPFKTKKGQDVGACLEYLRKGISRQEIKNELIVNGIKDLTRIDDYVDVVMRTRAELKSWVKKVGNSMVKEKAGLS